MRKEKGVTLIVLVITIVVLIILAGVAIVSLSGNNGITNRARQAKTESEAASVNEEAKVGEYETKISSSTGGGGSGVLMAAIQKALNGDTDDINALFGEGMEVYIVDVNTDNNTMVELFIYQGEECYIFINNTTEDVSILDLNSYARKSNVQTVLSDINVLKGLIGKSLSQYIDSNQNVNIPNFSEQNIPLSVTSYGESNYVRLNKYSALTGFHFNLKVDDFENMTVLSCEMDD